MNIARLNQSLLHMEGKRLGVVVESPEGPLAALGDPGVLHHAGHGDALLGVLRQQKG